MQNATTVIFEREAIEIEDRKSTLTKLSIKFKIDPPYPY
jgi:hypothetical protein